jgi:3-hydroxyisobutyrate dehydrogenase-like beta-hydroxyacid dehydrogenase
MNTKPKIAYIGLGLMGLPMAKHLISSGYEVHGYDIHPDQMVKAKSSGVVTHSSLQSVAKSGQIILLNLPTFTAIKEVVFGENGIAQVVEPTQCVIDFSTNPVVEGSELIKKFRSQTKCAWLDAPVSGGPAAAGSGNLTIMLGSMPDEYATNEDLLKTISGQLTLVGPPGSGLVAKTLNQLIVGCLHAVIAESVSIAQKSGIDAHLIPTALAGGHADGVLMQQIFPRMMAADFAPRGYARQLLKDLEMVNSYATDLKVPTPMTSQALTLYRILIEMGHSELDTGSILKVIQR